MSKKKVGIVVAILCIVCALTLGACRSMKITKKTTSDVSASGVSSSTSASSNKQSNNTEVVNNKNSSNKEVVTDSNKTSSTEVPNSKSDSKSSAGKGWESISPDSVNYSGTEKTTSGVVVEKSVFLNGDVLVHCLTIEIGVGSTSQKVDYYCSYNAYKAVSKNDIVSVSYIGVSEKTFTLTSVSK